MLDVFNQDAFSTVSLTQSILAAPYKPARIGELGLFGEQGIVTTTAVIEEKDGELTLIQTSPRGGPGSSIGEQKRTVRSFAVPHLERESTVMADEVQNVRAFGSEDALAGVQTIINQRLAQLRAEHEVTLEHMRMSAIQGIVLDADGSTLFDLFTEFGVVQQTADLDVDPATDQGGTLRGNVVAAQRLVEAELGAEPISGFRAFCGPTFYDGLRADQSLQGTLRYADAQSLLMQDLNHREFNFAGVTWEEYRGGTDYIAADEAFLVPTGTRYFQTYFAPADYIETVNTVGLPMYAKMFQDTELNRWARVHTQSNPLTLCTRPRIVIKLALV
jgi:hypothetical protein